MNLRNSLFLLLAFSAIAVAELPGNISDQKIRQVVEYLDAKINKIYKLFDPMPTAGYALCLNSSGKVGHCVSAVGAAGACACE